MALFELDGNSNYQPIIGSPAEMDIFLELDGADNIMPREAVLDQDIPDKTKVLNTVTVYDIVSGINVAGVFANLATSGVQLNVKWGAYGDEFTGSYTGSGGTVAGTIISLEGLLYEQLEDTNIILI